MGDVIVDFDEGFDVNFTAATAGAGALSRADDGVGSGLDAATGGVAGEFEHQRSRAGGAAALAAAGRAAALAAALAAAALACAGTAAAAPPDGSPAHVGNPGGPPNAAAAHDGTSPGTTTGIGSGPRKPSRTKLHGTGPPTIGPPMIGPVGSKTVGSGKTRTTKTGAKDVTASGAEARGAGTVLNGPASAGIAATPNRRQALVTLPPLPAHDRSPALPLRMASGWMTLAAARREDRDQTAAQRTTVGTSTRRTAAQPAARTAASTSFDLTESDVTASDGTTKALAAGSVSVDPSPPADLGTIAIAGGPAAVAVTDTRAYVTTYDADALTIVDTVSGRVIGTVPVTDPVGVAVKPNGTRVYVAGTTTDTVTVIDPAAGTTVGSPIPVGKTPTVLAISPDGKTVYVVNAGDSSVSKISTSTNKVAATVKGIGDNPTAITVSPDGRKVYVTTDSGVSVFGSTSTKVTAITGVGDYPVATAVSRDGKRIFVVSLDGSITAVETTKYTVVDVFDSPAPGVPTAVAVLADGATLLVTDYLSGSVSAFDTATGTLIVTTPTAAGPADVRDPQLALSPDGMQAYVTGDAGLEVVSLVPPNTAPVAGTPVVAPPTATGVVTGTLGVTDADGDALTYTVTGAPTRGTVTIGSDGSFTYTPTAAARHQAAKVGADPSVRTDAFTVTVTDGRRGSVAQTVTPSILPANAVPTSRTSVGAPSYSTGIVKGTVTGSDKDRDPLVYAVSGTSAKGGTVTLTSAGKFVYTPTAAARRAAAAAGATTADKTDTFTVTIGDGYGGVVPVTVTVKVSPKSTA